VRQRFLAASLALALLCSACGGGSQPTRAPSIARAEQSRRLVTAVILGVQRDFRESTSPAWFASCFLIEFRAELTDQALGKLAAIKQSAGEPAVARALNRLAVPAADRCGPRRFVPELLGPASAL